jgi:hypothetical protein
MMGLELRGMLGHRYGNAADWRTRWQIRSYRGQASGPPPVDDLTPHPPRR